MKIREQFLPDFKARTTPANMLIFHCNAYDLDTFCGYMKEYQTSAHYYIDEQGEITRLVEEDNVAYHAGKSYWRGQSSLNQNSVGIELQSKSLGQTPYSEKQINALIELSQDIITRHKITPQNILGHSDAAPDRKPDPGLCFPWKFLSQNNIGLYPQEIKSPNNEDIAALLSEIGYQTETQEQIQASAYAFCRRFVPKFVKIDTDVMHLVDNVLPQDFSFMNDFGFKCVLNSVADVYKKNSNSASHQKCIFPQSHQR